MEAVLCVFDTPVASEAASCCRPDVS